MGVINVRLLYLTYGTWKFSFPKLAFSEFTQKDGKMLVCDQRDRAITSGFWRDLHLALMFSGLLQRDLFKGN